MLSKSRLNLPQISIITTDYKSRKWKKSRLSVNLSLSVCVCLFFLLFAFYRLSACLRTIVNNYHWFLRVNVFSYRFNYLYFYQYMQFMKFFFHDHSVHCTIFVDTNSMLISLSCFSILCIFFVGISIFLSQFFSYLLILFPSFFSHF